MAWSGELLDRALRLPRGEVNIHFEDTTGDAAGRPPGILRGGWHLRMPFIYRIHKAPLVTIPQGKIGYVYARDGDPLHPSQTLARVGEALNASGVANLVPVPAPAHRQRMPVAISRKW